MVGGLVGAFGSFFFAGVLISGRIADRVFLMVFWGFWLCRVFGCDIKVCSV